MTNDFLALAPVSTAPAAAPADVLLDDLMARVGVDALVAALTDPALLAVLDQHAAAVRDALTGAGRAVDAEGLGAYARSIMAAATRSGRALPEPGHAPVTGAGWLITDWHLARLAAVCMIAEAADLL